MTATGGWTIGLALAYTLFLVGAGRVARARASADGDYFVGGRSFRPITVAFCITGLFSGSSFIAILELSYKTGVSAIWYGIAESVQIVLIAAVLVVPFRERMVVTVSGMIGAFETLGTSGIGDPSKLASAIGEVLVATFSGLLIAVPAFGLYYFLRNRSAKAIHDIQDTMNSLFRKMPYEQLAGAHIGGEEIYAATPNWVQAHEAVAAQVNA